MSSYPESWNRKTDAEIEADLRAMYEEEGMPYDEDELPELTAEEERDAHRVTQESLDAARRARQRVSRRMFGTDFEGDQERQGNVCERCGKHVNAEGNESWTILCPECFRKMFDGEPS